MLYNVHTDVTMSRHIRMDNFRQKSHRWRFHRVPVCGHKLMTSIPQKKKFTYWNGITMYRKNFPPSYGLPTGPKIVACQCESWLSNGTASMPSVASTSSDRTSPRRRVARKLFIRPWSGDFSAICIKHVRQKQDDIRDPYICKIKRMLLDFEQ